MRFFEPPPPSQPRERPRHARPAWMKPDAVLPGVIAVERVVGRSDEAVVAVSSVAAYPNGFEFTLTAVLRVERRGPGPIAHHGWVDPDEPVPDKLLRVGVQFADGRRVTNLIRPGAGGPRPADSPPELMLTSGGGSGDSRRYDTSYFVSPLPPPGPMRIVCEWPAYGLDESSVEVDAHEVLDASVRAIRLWPDDDQTGDGPMLLGDSLR